MIVPDKMPKSKLRRSAGKRRNKSKQTRARETQVFQQQAEKKRGSLASYQRRRAFGWALVVLGVSIGLQHIIDHMGFWTLISPGWDDIVAGYPMAGLLGVAGAIVLS